MDLQQQLENIKRHPQELWDESFQTIQIVHLNKDDYRFEPSSVFPARADHFKMLRNMKNFKVLKIVRFR